MTLLRLLIVMLSCVPCVHTDLIRYKYISVSIGNATCDVLEFGARGDGKTDDTTAIQSAIDHCAALPGGGRVILTPPHKYLITSISFTASNLELHIPDGATLLAIDDFAAWANGSVGSAMLVAKGSKGRPLEHIGITGKGTVDGQGLKWWRACKKPGQEQMFRPHTVDFTRVRFAILSDVTFLDGPNHVLELGCDHCEISAVKVLNPPSTGECEKYDTCSHNTDAVDVHGDPFWIHDVNFSTGDDNVAGHANNTLVEDSYFGSGHGASIGSLCDSYITNFTVRNCTFHGTTAAARIKSHPGCGGHVWDVVYSDLTLYDVPTSIQMNQFYFASKHPPPSTMRFESIVFRNITSYRGGGGSHGSGGDTDAVINFDCDTHFNGVNNCDVSLSDIKHLEMRLPNKGMVCKGVRGSATNLVGISSCLRPEDRPEYV